MRRLLLVMTVFTASIAAVISVTFTDSTTAPSLVSRPAPRAVGDTESPGILVSRQLLEAEQLTVWDVVRLAAAPDGSNQKRFRIAGTYEPTPDPMRVTRASGSRRWGDHPTQAPGSE